MSAGDGLVVVLVIATVVLLAAQQVSGWMRGE